MRMWMINPRLMCRRHLLGEHGEIHKHRHNFVKRHSMNGRVRPIVLIEVRAMKARHDELVREIARRGYKHNSPYVMPCIKYLEDDIINAKVDRVLSIVELSKRCGHCRQLINNQ